MFLIPFISSFLYRAGGSDQWKFPLNQKWWRWGMGLPIAIITGQWLYILTYYLATAVTVYGDNSPISKLLGVKAARIIHGFAFGMASLRPLYGLWCAVVFYIIFELADHGIIDNSYAEAIRGFAGTLIFIT